MTQHSQFFLKISECAEQNFPTFAAIEVTNRCNAGCDYCFIDKKSTHHELSTLQLHQIIDKLNDENIINVTITGGEPFLRDDISEILEYLFSKDFFYISIYSNGTLLKREHFTLLEKYRDLIFPFRMTVFSHIEEIHDSYMHIPGSLKTIIRNGQELINRGIKVQLSIPLLLCNSETIHESMSYFVGQGFQIGISPFKLLTESNKSDAMYSMISEDFYYTGFKNITEGKSIIDLDRNPSDQLCRGIKEAIMIDTHGKIHPCTAFREFEIGSIFDRASLRELLLQNQEYQKLRHIKKSDLLSCKECIHKNICTPCLALQHTFHNNLDTASESTCNMMKAAIKFNSDFL